MEAVDLGLEFLYVPSHAEYDLHTSQVDAQSCKTTNAPQLSQIRFGQRFAQQSTVDVTAHGVRLQARLAGGDSDRDDGRFPLPDDFGHQLCRLSRR